MLIAGHQKEAIKSDKGQVTKNHQSPEMALCSAQCVSCPKQFNAIYIDTHVFIERYVLSVAGVKHRISNPMFRILCAFDEYQDEVVSRSFLLGYGWGIDHKVNNNVTVAISELRALLKHKSTLEIITIHGKGYQMVNKNRGFFE
jgi:DNA-binding winged helix-turn-helix (wHTH) protein